MDQTDQGNDANASSDLPLKRKRGRPRKHLKPNHEENFRVVKSHYHHHGTNYIDSAPTPPGSKPINGSQHRQADSVDNKNSNNTSNPMLGKKVSGVIEAVFDDGYLLCVKVGNTGTILRGVVFKPGNYMPVSAENDVVPDLQMIRRTENYAQAHARNFSHYRSRNVSSNRIVSKRKQVNLVAAQPSLPIISEGNLVPVVLQPSNLINGGVLLVCSEPSNVSQPAHLATSKGKKVVVESGLLSSIPDDNSTGLENGPCNRSGLESSSMPFENLVSGVLKRVEVPVHESRAHNQPAGKIPGEESVHGLDVGDRKMDGALVIEPLQAVDPIFHKNLSTLHKPLEQNRSGKMTELLQVMQDNMMQNQVTWVED